MFLETGFREEPVTLIQRKHFLEFTGTKKESYSYVILNTVVVASRQVFGEQSVCS